MSHTSSGTFHHCISGWRKRILLNLLMKICDVAAAPSTDENQNLNPWYYRYSTKTTLKFYILLNFKQFVHCNIIPKIKQRVLEHHGLPATALESCYTLTHTHTHTHTHTETGGHTHIRTNGWNGSSLYLRPRLLPSGGTIILNRTCRRHVIGW